MLNTIHKLQQKSEDQRKSITFFGALLGTLLIATVWATASGFGAFQNEEENTASQVASPLEAVKERSTPFFREFGNKVEALKSEISR